MAGIARENRGQKWWADAAIGLNMIQPARKPQHYDLVRWDAARIPEILPPVTEFSRKYRTGKFWAGNVPG